MSAENSSFIEVGSLVKRYGAQTVIDDVSFHVAEGEFLTFLGPSGCGKTTILRCVAGFIKADRGSIRIDGNDMTEVPPYRRHLGMVFQNYALFPHMTVFDNVGFGLRIRRTRTDDAKRRIEKALEMVRLGGLGSRYPKQLSGGQQQRVALARALVYEPRVLLLDEPLSNLDAKLRVEMRSEIRALQRELGVTAVYVTHDQEEALSISDRVMVMNQGRIEQISTPWEIYNKPQTPFVAAFVGTSNILPATRNGDTVRVADAFDLPLPPATDLGRDLWLVARPEGLTIHPPEANGQCASVQGNVQAIAMLGATIRATVSIAPQTTIVVDVPHAGTFPNIEPGDAVSVRFSASQAVFIPR